MKCKKILLISGILFLIAFAVFSFMIVRENMKSTSESFNGGPEGFVKAEEASFLTDMNIKFFEKTGKNDFWYDVSEVLGYIELAFASSMALLGLVFLIRGRSFKKVPGEIYITGVLYALCIVIYFVSFKLVINYRPVELESSYPSSHTLMSLCVAASAILILGIIANKKSSKIIIYVISSLCGVMTVVSRMLSGYHWITDILGCLLLTISMLCFYCLAFVSIRKNGKKEKLL